MPQGTVCNLTMNSTDSKIYPGIAREPGRSARPIPTDPAKLIVTTSHPAPYTRKVAVYVPKQYVAGTAAPFIVGADGPDRLLFTTLDNLIAQKRVPAMVAISIGNGSGDAQGSQRGLEYDTMSGRYAEFVETEVLPLVEKQCNVKLTKDPEGRATMGGSSGGSAALIMAWYHPEWYHRVLDLLGHVREPAVAAEPRDAARRVGVPREADPQQPRRSPFASGCTSAITISTTRTPCATACTTGWWPTRTWRKCWPPRAITTSSCSRSNAGHTERIVKQQTLPQALEYVWHGYKPQVPQPTGRQ